MLKQVIKWGGRLLALAAVGLLLWSAKTHWAALSTWRMTPMGLAAMAVAAVGLGFVFLFQCEAWHQNISGVSAMDLRRRVTWPSYGVTQVAKYLPGNVLHYVGRHIWLTRRGVPQRAIITSAVWEAALLSGAALFVGSIACYLSDIPLPRVGDVDLALILKAMAPALLVAAAAVAALRPVLGRFKAMVPPTPALLRAGVASIGFFVGQGLAFSLVLTTVGARPSADAWVIANLSWVVGYLTPGAPGGVGSREATLVFLATPLVGAPHALILAALFRVVSIIADLVCFLLNSWLSRRDDRVGAAAPAQPLKEVLE